MMLRDNLNLGEESL